MLVGAYVGETLREALGGRWIAGEPTESGVVTAASYVLELFDHGCITPVEEALERMTGDSTAAPSEYARRIMRRR